MCLAESLICVRQVTVQISSVPLSEANFISSV